MSAKILDGVACAKVIRAEIAERVKRIPVKPGLAVILVGDDPASAVYVRNKEKAAEAAGFKSMIDHLPVGISESELMQVVYQYNGDHSVHGFIVQLPLPRKIDVERVVCEIDPVKDVDGLNPLNQGLLLRGVPRVVPATPRGVLELLKRNAITTAGKRVVIVGRSPIVGRSLSVLLLMKGEMGDATVTVAHSLTPDLPDVCREADILVAAIGQPKLITADFVKEGAVVVDVGINKTPHGLCGDVDLEAVKEVASAITPVPGGVGPMTIAMLLQNTLDTFLRQNPQY